MRYLITLLAFLFSGLLFGQKPTPRLELEVIKQTLPQLLDSNPNSLASFSRDGGTYKLLRGMGSLMAMVDSTSDTTSFQQELEIMADSVAAILSKSKITVYLSDTLFAYKYDPQINMYIDGDSDTSDIRSVESWTYCKNDLIEVFQTNYEYRGLQNPVDLEFIDLIKSQVFSELTCRKVKLKKLNGGHYIFKKGPAPKSDSLDGLQINALGIYRPVFNESMDRACYLFSYNAGNGAHREFVFVEKRNERWVWIESYGTHHIDGNYDYVR